MSIRNCYLDMLKKREGEIKFFPNLFQEAILINLTKSAFLPG